MSERAKRTRSSTPKQRSRDNNDATEENPPTDTATGVITAEPSAQAGPMTPEALENKATFDNLTEAAQNDRSGHKLPQRLPACCFQCRKCNTIVGDTSDWVTSDKKAKTISLGRARQVEIQKKLHMSQSGDDFGSVFSKITCKSCKTELGKMYRNTAPEYDLARNSFTFDATKILCYVLGSNCEPALKGRKRPRKEAEEEFNVDFKEMDSQIGNLYDAVNDLSRKFLGFQDEHLKMEHVFLIWEQRISKMEQTLAQLQGFRKEKSPRRLDHENTSRITSGVAQGALQQATPPREQHIRFAEPYAEPYQRSPKRPRRVWQSET